MVVWTTDLHWLYGFHWFDDTDFNHDNQVNIADAIIVIKILAGKAPGTAFHLDADVNGDKAIGFEDLLFLFNAM